MSNSGMPGLRRGFQLMEWLADSPDGLSFMEIAKKFDNLAPATLSRLLKALLEEELISQNGTQKYVCGTRFVTLARRALGVESRAEIVKPVLRELAEDTGESAAYFEQINDRHVLVAKHEMPNSFHYQSSGFVFPDQPTDPVRWACEGDAADFPELLRQKVGSQAVVAVHDHCAAMEKFIRFDVIRIVAPVRSCGGNAVKGSLGITAIKQDWSETELQRMCERVSEAVATLRGVGR